MYRASERSSECAAGALHKRFNALACELNPLAENLFSSGVQLPAGTSLSSFECVRPFCRARQVKRTTHGTILTRTSRTTVRTVQTIQYERSIELTVCDLTGRRDDGISLIMIQLPERVVHVCRGSLDLAQCPDERGVSTLTGDTNGFLRPGSERIVVRRRWNRNIRQ